MADLTPNWVKQELEELSRAKVGVLVVLLAGLAAGGVGAWWLAVTVYSGQIATLERQLKAAEDKASDRAPSALPNGPTIRGPVLVGWGANNERACRAIVNGEALMDFRDKYDMAIVCGLLDAAADRFEDSRISVVHGYTIVPQAVEMYVPYSKPLAEAIDAAAESAKKTIPANKAAVIVVNSQMWYETILIPRGFDVRAIQKLSDVERYGGRLVRNLTTRSP